MPAPCQDVAVPFPARYAALSGQLSGQLSALAQAVAHFDMSAPGAVWALVAVDTSISELLRQHTALSLRLSSVVASAEKRGAATHFTVVTALDGRQESLDTLHTCAERGDLLAARVLALISERATLAERVLRLIEKAAEALAVPLLATVVDLCELAPPRASLVGSLDSHAPPSSARSGAPDLVQSLRNAPGRNDA